MAKHRRTKHRKKLKGNELDQDLTGWTYGRAVAKEVTLRKEYRQRRRLKNWEE